MRGTTPRIPSRSGRQEGARRPAQRVSGAGAKKQFQARPARGSAPLPGAAKGAPRPPKAGKPAASYDPVAPARVAEILKRLDQLYPGVTCALGHKSAWELLVATILSAQCTDVRVNMVTPELFRKYPTPADFARLKPEQLEPDIRSTGFFRNKSKSIVGAAQKVVKEFGGEVPSEMDQILTLPGVARKTANVVLGTWFGKAEGVVVDTHVYRIARRLELTTNTDVQRIEQDLMHVIPREKWILFAHQVIHFGREICEALKPKCDRCPVERLCYAKDRIPL